jgi:hypothetical protein
MWPNERLQLKKKPLQVLQNDYKHTGYDNNYKMNDIGLRNTPHADNVCVFPK